MVRRELAVPGRYHFTPQVVAPAEEPWWMRVWDWFADRWSSLWHALFSRVHVGRETAASIGDVMLALVGLLLLYVAIRLLREVQLARARPRIASEPLPDPPSPAALYRQARAAACRGDYGAAALLLFTATVALLDRRGAVDVTSSATVGDLRRVLRVRNAPLVPAFDAVAAPFVQTVYAERAVDAAQWERADEAFGSLSRCHPERVDGEANAPIPH